IALLNRAEPVTLAVAVDDELADAGHEAGDGAPDAERTRTNEETGADGDADSEPTADGEPGADEEGETSADGADGVLVATESAVIGLALTDGRWAVVDRLDYGDGVKRYDALRSCESAVRHALGEA
ncbi:MAG: hypothetical protein ABEI75_04195, partial [Halobaculum sp.]